MKVLIKKINELWDWLVRWQLYKITNYIRFLKTGTVDPKLRTIWYYERIIDDLERQNRNRTEPAEGIVPVNKNKE